MTEHRIEVFADYHQFYLWDPSTDPEAPTDFSDQDTRCMVKLAPHVVVVQPLRNMDVLVIVRLENADPGFEAADFDQIVECMIEVPGGQLQVHECTGEPVLDLEVAPGCYQVRVLCAGLDTLSADGLDGNDSYTIQVWPGQSDGLKVVKQFG